MNILVIGGAGYIGSHLVKMLCNFKNNVFVLDNLSTGYECNIDTRAKFYLGDIRNEELLVSIFKFNKIEVVVHLAAFSIVCESIKEPLKYYNNNVYGMQVLLSAMSKANITKIVFSSSAAVYGEHKNMPLRETIDTKPNSPYGNTKLIMEIMIKDYCKNYKCEFIALRYFNVSGASLDNTIGECHKPETHIIPLIIKSVMENKIFEIYGNDYETIDGTCIRDYIYIEDLCSAHSLAIDYLNKKNTSRVINLGYGHGYSIFEIIDSVERVSGLKVNYIIKKRRNGDPSKLIASNDNAINILKWEYKYDSIDFIVKTAFEFYKNKKKEYN